MDEVRQVVERAARRLGWVRAGRIITTTLVVFMAFACIVILCDKVFFFPQAACWTLAGGAAALAVVTAVTLARGWPTRLSAALEIDERLRLSERVSSALAVARADDDFARAVKEDARAYARGISIARTFPLTMDRRVYTAFLLAAIAVAILGWMPQWDVLHRKERLELARKEQQAVETEAKRMRREIARIQRRTGEKRPQRLREQLERMEEVVRLMEHGKLTRAEALARLSDLAQSMREAQKGLARRSILPATWTTPSDLKMTRKAADALRRQDFEGMKKHLRDLGERAASQDLSPSERAQLERELRNLAQGLGENEALSKALSKFASALSEKDFHQLQEAMKDLDFSADQLAQAAEEMEIMKQMADACRNGKNALGSGVPKTSTYSGIYTPEQMGSGQCQGQGQGQGAGQGPGMGGPGMGQGGVAQIDPEDVTFEVKKLKGQIQSGRVVGSFFSDGKQIKGDVKVEYVEEVEAAEAEAAQALEQEKIPRAYEDYVRDYFHQMKSP